MIVKLKKGRLGCIVGKRFRVFQSGFQVQLTEKEYDDLVKLGHEGKFSVIPTPKEKPKEVKPAEITEKKETKKPAKQTKTEKTSDTSDTEVKL